MTPEKDQITEHYAELVEDKMFYRALQFLLVTYLAGFGAGYLQHHVFFAPEAAHIDWGYLFIGLILPGIGFIFLLRKSKTGWFICMSFFLFFFLNCFAALIYCLIAGGFQPIEYIAGGKGIPMMFLAALITALISSEKITSRFQISKSMSTAAMISAFVFTIVLIVFDAPHALKLARWLY